MTSARLRLPTHPGALLREDLLPALGVSVAATARDFGILRQTLHRILAERAPVTPAMALRLGRYCGNGPDLWLTMQSKRDLWQAEQTMSAEIERTPQREGADEARCGQG
jgi:addiction module HigA family antidote